MIGVEEDAIVSIGLPKQDIPCSEPSPLAKYAAAQLDAYFRGEIRTFDLPVRPQGSAFQVKVWNALLQIPYGETRTYGQIAASLGNPNSARAVGMACNRNPIWIFIPCHRVVGKSGGLTGYAGGLSMKQALLELEQLHKKTRKCKLPGFSFICTGGTSRRCLPLLP